MALLKRYRRRAGGGLARRVLFLVSQSSLGSVEATASASSFGPTSLLSLSATSANAGSSPLSVSVTAPISPASTPAATGGFGLTTVTLSAAAANAVASSSLSVNVIEPTTPSPYVWIPARPGGPRDARFFVIGGSTPPITTDIWIPARPGGPRSSRLFRAISLQSVQLVSATASVGVNSFGPMVGLSSATATASVVNFEVSAPLSGGIYVWIAARPGGPRAGRLFIESAAFNVTLVAAAAAAGVAGFTQDRIAVPLSPIAASARAESLITGPSLVPAFATASAPPFGLTNLVPLSGAGATAGSAPLTGDIAAPELASTSIVAIAEPLTFTGGDINVPLGDVFGAGGASPFSFSGSPNVPLVPVTSTGIAATFSSFAMLQIVAAAASAAASALTAQVAITLTSAVSSGVAATIAPVLQVSIVAATLTAAAEAFAASQNDTVFLSAVRGNAAAGQLSFSGSPNVSFSSASVDAVAAAMGIDLVGALDAISVIATASAFGVDLVTGLVTVAATGSGGFFFLGATVLQAASAAALVESLMVSAFRIGLMLINDRIAFPDIRNDQIRIAR